MAHKRSSSRMHAAGSAGTEETGPHGSQLVASSSFVLPSYSTPDMNVVSTSTSSSNFTFSHSNSLPSMPDMSSSSSRSSTSLSSSSTSSLSSFSSSISANAIYQIAQGVSEKTDPVHSWDNTKTGSRRESNTGLLVSTADRDSPGSTLTNLQRRFHPRLFASYVRRSLPHSTWDRLVLVIFLVYFTVLLRAMAGYGGSSSHFPGCTRSPSVLTPTPSNGESLTLGTVHSDITLNSTSRLPTPLETDLNGTAIHNPITLPQSPLLAEDLVIDSSLLLKGPSPLDNLSASHNHGPCSCNCAEEAPPVEYANQTEGED
ncbi:hypothetical protein QCA50_006675 [Cerrena zonata]|uniref:Uncharacterized protein n=1 Tax=Cerrena zonata TaxID=2478898 RepID=A0AAW0GKF6_9APHY